MGRLDGRVALVTGGSRGFGRATCIRCAREGADVVIGYRAAKAEALAVAREVERLGRRALAVQADVADGASVPALVEQVLAAFGQIDVAVNNAGVMDVHPFAEQNPSTWDEMLAVNVRGVLAMTRAVLPAMRTRGYGRIVNLASQLGHTGGEDFAVYSGTKAFVLAFTRSIAREVGRFGITVNAVCPGSIVTDMNRFLYPDAERQTARAAQLPLRRMGDPEDVAAAVLYFASEDGRFTTGQCLDVNGGSTMV